MFTVKARLKKGDPVSVHNCVGGLRIFNGSEGVIKAVDHANGTPYLVRFTEKVQEVSCGVVHDWEEMWFTRRELKSNG